MNIVYLVGSLHPGGAEIQKVGHLIALQRAGHKVMCILPNGMGDVTSPLLVKLRAARIPILDLTAHDCLDPESRIYFMTRFFANVPQRRPDVVHASGYPNSLEGVIAAWQAGVKSRILSWESLGFERERFAVQPYLEYVGTKLATHIVVNSLAGREAAKTFYGADEDRIVHIPNALMEVPELSSELRKQARDHFGFADDHVVVGYLANFKEDGLKNQMLVIEAAARLKPLFPHVRFIMPGAPSRYMEQCRLRAKALDVSDIVLLPGRIDDLNLLRGWDIGVNTSRTEGMSSSIQEQMVYGEAPFVASNVGGNKELVVRGATGLLFDDNDVDGLVIGLKLLIENPELRRQMGKYARDHVIRKFSWDAVVYPMWMRLYEYDLSRGTNGADSFFA